MKISVEVSIILVSYNTQHLLLNCINSIYKETKGVDFEIIVVDNASEDESVKMIEKNFQKIKRVQLEQNIGFGQANNKGVEIAGGKYLFFLNSDTVLENNAVKMFRDYMESNKAKNIGAVGGILIDEHGNSIHSSGRFPSIFFNKFFCSQNNMQEKTAFDKAENEFNVDYVTGADLFMTKSLFFELGGFDKNYFMYFEETDLQYRMKKKGLSRKIISGPKIFHLESGSFKDKKMSNQKRILMDRSRFVFFKKNYSLFHYFAYRLFYTVTRIKLFFNKEYSYKENATYFLSLLGVKQYIENKKSL